MGYVYMIHNKVNGKIYIGSTVNYENRVKSHKRGLKGNYHDNKKLQDEYNIYGVECFEYTLLCEEESDKKRFDIEEDIIQSLKTYENGYNLSKDGRGKYIVSDETREKMRQNTLGENNPFFGKKHTEEARKKISSKAKEKIGDKNPFYGKTHTKETIAKIAKTFEETKKNGWINPQKGIPKTEEAKKNNALSQPNRKSVYVEGKLYISISECAKSLGVVNATVTNRIKSDKYPEYYYIID